MEDLMKNNHINAERKFTSESQHATRDANTEKKVNASEFEKKIQNRKSDSVCIKGNTRDQPKRKCQRMYNRNSVWLQKRLWNQRANHRDESSEC